jgi:sec-independent protein translocase protein TatA
MLRGGGLFQPGHLIVVLLIALVIFGPGKLPELGSALGQGIREFKRSVEHPDQDDAAPQAGGALSAGQASGALAATAAGSPATSEALTCTRCQAAMPASHRYCTRCGASLAQG